jgi:hypothetical protein
VHERPEARVGHDDVRAAPQQPAPLGAEQVGARVDHDRGLAEAARRGGARAARCARSPPARARAPRRAAAPRRARSPRRGARARPRNSRSLSSRAMPTAWSSVAAITGRAIGRGASPRRWCPRGARPARRGTRPRPPRRRARRGSGRARRDSASVAPATNTPDRARSSTSPSGRELGVRGGDDARVGAEVARERARGGETVARPRGARAQRLRDARAQRVGDSLASCDGHVPSSIVGPAGSARRVRARSAPRSADATCSRPRGGFPLLHAGTPRRPPARGGLGRTNGAPGSCGAWDGPARRPRPERHRSCP